MYPFLSYSWLRFKQICFAPSQLQLLAHVDLSEHDEPADDAIFHLS